MLSGVALPAAGQWELQGKSRWGLEFYRSLLPTAAGLSMLSQQGSAH